MLLVICGGISFFYSKFCDDSHFSRCREFGLEYLDPKIVDCDFETLPAGKSVIKKQKVQDCSAEYRLSSIFPIFFTKPDEYCIDNKFNSSRFLQSVRLEFVYAGKLEEIRISHRKNHVAIHAPNLGSTE